MTNPATLIQQRQMIWGAMRNLMLQAETSSRPMTKMQIAAFDQLHADLDYIDRQLWKLTDTPVTAAPGRTYSVLCAGFITAASITSERITVEPECTIEPEFVEPECTIEPDDYEKYKELYATTGDESAMVKMLDCVTME